MTGRNSRLGCLVTSVLLLAFLYTVYQVGPVYLNKVDFEEDLSRIASRAAVEEWKTPFIEEQILIAAEVRSFSVERDEIKVVRSSRLSGTPMLRIQVRYTYPLDLAGFSKTLDFEANVQSIMGRL